MKCIESRGHDPTNAHGPLTSKGKRKGKGKGLYRGKSTGKGTSKGKGKDKRHDKSTFGKRSGKGSPRAGPLCWLCRGPHQKRLSVQIIQAACGPHSSVDKVIARSLTRICSVKTRRLTHLFTVVLPFLLFSVSVRYHFDER